MYKKFFALALIISVFGLALAGCGKDFLIDEQDGQKQETKLRVVASFYPMYDFAQKIGGGHVQVINMVPAGTEPHDWEPTTTDIKELETADVFIYNGAGMEHWVDDVLEGVSNQGLITAEASQGVALRPAEKEDGEAEEDDHGAFDPHVWLAPQNAKTEMANIKTAFVKADPANEMAYEDNFETYAAELDRLDKEYQDTLTSLPNKEVVAAHEAFGYLCDAYGLTQVGIEGLSPDSEPDPARMAEVIELVKQHKIKTIFFEELVSPKVAETIAQETGAAAEELNPLEGLSDEELAFGADYFSVMRTNLTALENALKGS